MERVTRVLGVDAPARAVWIPSVAVGLLLGLAALAHHSAIASLLLRVVFGRFVYTTSNAGVLLVLVTFALAAATCALPDRTKGTTTVGPLEAGRLLLGAIAIGHLLHGLALASWLRELGGAARARAWVWSAGEQSFTTITHSHLGKTGFMALARRLPTGQALESYDMAGPLARFVPLPLSLGISLTCLASLGLLLLGAYAMRRRFRESPSIGAVYLLSGLSCIQLIADGGPLALRLGPSAVALCTIVLRRKAESWNDTWRRVRGPAAACLVVHALAWCTFSGQPWIFAVVSLAPQVAGFGLLFVLADALPTAPRQGAAINAGGRGRSWPRVAARGRGRSWPRVAAGVGLMLVLGAGLARDLRTDVLPLFTPLAESDRVFLVDLADGAVIESSRASGVDSAYSVYAGAGDPLKPRHVLIARSGSGQADPGGLFAILDADLPPVGARIDGGEAFRIEGLLPIRTDLHGWVLHARRGRSELPPLGHSGGDVIDRNNRYVWLRVLDLALRRAEIDEYVVVPIEDLPQLQSPPSRKAHRTRRQDRAEPSSAHHARRARALSFTARESTSAPTCISRSG